MMKHFYLYLFIFLCVSCQSSKVDLSAIKKEIMVMHDEAMGKMGILRNTRKALMERQNKKADSTDTEVLKTITEIEVAEEVMMEWMHNYEADFSDTESKMIKYYQAQSQSIANVNNQMQEALTRGERMLE